ncbi:hypothetical protein ACFSTA_00915 [Ornithinibacillus salinisoli]|uniref:Uncharacterized protein n=1 Tax=Ornithinibacillus salinisoli TaxID=1848459 RepID=A0ABW4VT60_9BACI
MKKLSLFTKLTFALAMIFLIMGLIFLVQEINEGDFKLVRSHSVMFIFLGIGLFFSSLANVQDRQD